MKTPHLFLALTFVAAACALPEATSTDIEDVDPEAELADGMPPEWEGGDEDDPDDTYGAALEPLLASPAADEPAPAAEPPATMPTVVLPAGGATYAREMAERRYGVRIRDQRHRRPRVVYSVRLRDLTPGESLVVNAEVTLSRCNEKDIAGLSGDASITPCSSADLRRSPYAYTPNFSTAIVIGDSASDASGPRVSQWVEQRCPKKRHHCARALPRIVVDAASIPDSGDRWVNLVVTADANGANARNWDVMEVEQHHGGLHVTRVPAHVTTSPERFRTTERVADAIQIDRTDSSGVDGENRRIVYRVRVDGLRGGEIIDATGRFYASLGGYDVNPLITSQIILVGDRDARRTDGTYDRPLGARNGHNCYDHSGNPTCVYAKSGAVRVPNHAPSTMWVTLIAAAVRSDAAPDGNNRVRLHDRDGELVVRVRR